MAIAQASQLKAFIPIVSNIDFAPSHAMRSMGDKQQTADEHE